MRLQSGERAVEQELVAALDIQQQQQHHNISSGGHRARVSMNHNTLEVAETELDPPQDHSVGRIWCLRLGMTADAWDGWGIMHVNPAVAMSYFFIAEAGCYAMCFYQLSGIPWNGSLLSLVMFVSYSVYTVLSIALDCTIWRYGPKAVDHKFFPPIIMIASMSAMPYIFLAYLGPVHSIPFNNRLHITIVNAVGSGLCVHGLLAGKSAGDRPPKPRTHLFGAFIRATLMTLQFIDALTDMSMIATLLDEVWNPVPRGLENMNGVARQDVINQVCMAAAESCRLQLVWKAQSMCGMEWIDCGFQHLCVNRLHVHNSGSPHWQGKSRKGQISTEVPSTNQKYIVACMRRCISLNDL